MQQVFCERRQKQISIPFQDRRLEERRRTPQTVPLERRQIISYIPSINAAELIMHQKKYDDFCDRRFVSRIAVNLPVVIDFQGNLSSGVTSDFSMDSVTILADIDVAKDSPVTIFLCFGHDFAYMKLTGFVGSVNEEKGNTKERFTIGIWFSELKDPEQTILDSCLKELESSFARDLSAAYESRSKLESDPRSIISLFVTDNPYLLHYRRSLSRDREIVYAVQSSKAKDGQYRHDNNISPRLLWSLIPQISHLAIQFGRDLLVRILPCTVSRIIMPKIAFAFIAHPRDISDISRKIPFAQFIPSRLIELWLRYQWPVIGSYVTGLKTRDGKEAIGAMLFSPLTTKQMIQNPRLARKRVYQTVQLAEKMGARIAGLGAFTSIVTKDGRDLLGKVNIGITTGNSYSAAIAVQNVVMASVLTNLTLPNSTAAIVGGAGSMGSACAKLMSRIVAKLILIDIKKEELRNVMQQLQGQSAQFEGTSRIDAVKQADVIIVATNRPYAVIFAEHIKPGAIVIDAAQPKNVSEGISLLRNDVLVIESAIVNTPGVDCNFDLGLGAGEALGCLTETMILTAIEWEGHYSLGKADPRQAVEMIKAGRELGFQLAYFRNSSGFINEEDLARVARARIRTSSYV